MTTTRQRKRMRLIACLAGVFVLLGRAAAPIRPQLIDRAENIKLGVLFNDSDDLE